MRRWRVLGIVMLAAWSVYAQDANLKREAERLLRGNILEVWFPRVLQNEGSPQINHADYPAALLPLVVAALL